MKCSHAKRVFFFLNGRDLSIHAFVQVFIEDPHMQITVLNAREIEEKTAFWKAGETYQKYCY